MRSSVHPYAILVISFAPVTFLQYYFLLFKTTATTEIYTLSLHDALPISEAAQLSKRDFRVDQTYAFAWMLVDPEIARSEEHTSELQSPYDLVCRLLLEKKKKNQKRKSK